MVDASHHRDRATRDGARARQGVAVEEVRKDENALRLLRFHDVVDVAVLETLGGDSGNGHFAQVVYLCSHVRK